MSIAIEQPPSSLPSDAVEYLQRMLIQISGQFENMEYELKMLQDKIKALENK